MKNIERHSLQRSMAIFHFHRIGGVVKLQLDALLSRISATRMMCFFRSNLLDLELAWNV